MIVDDNIQSLMILDHASEWASVPMCQVPRFSTLLDREVWGFWSPRLQLYTDLNYNAESQMLPHGWSSDNANCSGSILNMTHTKYFNILGNDFMGEDSTDLWELTVNNTVWQTASRWWGREEGVHGHLLMRASPHAYLTLYFCVLTLFCVNYRLD